MPISGKGRACGISKGAGEGVRGRVGSGGVGMGIILSSVIGKYIQHEFQIYSHIGEMSDVDVG